MKVEMNLPSLSSVCKKRENKPNQLKVKEKDQAKALKQEVKKLTDDDLRPEVIDTYYPTIQEMFGL